MIRFSAKDIFHCQSTNTFILFNAQLLPVSAARERINDVTPIRNKLSQMKDLFLHVHKQELFKDLLLICILFFYSFIFYKQRYTCNNKSRILKT